MTLLAAALMGDITPDGRPAEIYPLARITDMGGYCIVEPLAMADDLGRDWMPPQPPPEPEPPKDPEPEGEPE